MTSLEVKRKADIQKSGFFSIKQMRFCIKVCFLSPSVYLGIGLVWDNLSNPITTTHFLVRLLKSSSNWTKLSMMGPQLLSPSGDLGIGLVWNNLSNPIHPTRFLVRLLESSSNWTKLSMMGPQLLSPSGDLGIGLVWYNHPPTNLKRISTVGPKSGPTVEILFKLN